MHARDASGRKVSLLCDDSPCYSSRPLPTHAVSYSAVSHSLHYPLSRSNSASPNTPELMRSDSYDSQSSIADPASPMTPSVDYAFPRPPLYSISSEYGVEGAAAKHAYAHSARSSSYDEDVSAPSPPAERSGKRYPCRYRDSHGCEKTFTTSGHASRHSKIHTAEKAVQCTYPACHKKFTRADNMKQHLETHYKDKSRSSTGQRRAALAEARRNSSSGRSRSGRESAQWEVEQYPFPTPPAVTVATSNWDMRNLPLLNRPVTGRTPSGLDALAMAVACQEG